MAKILLVEDDNNLREIYEARLQAEGYTIVSAMDGEDALVVAKKEKPDLVISDVMMPRISGFEMLDILRNTEGLKDVRVIMLTALGQAEDKTRADALGADRYLVKSQVTLEDIVKAAQELIGPTGDSGTGTGAPASPAATAATTSPTAAPQPAIPVVSAPATPVAAPASPAPAPPIPVVAAPSASPSSPAPTPVAPASQMTTATTTTQPQPAPVTTPMPSSPVAPVSVSTPASVPIISTPQNITPAQTEPSTSATPSSAPEFVPTQVTPTPPALLSTAEAPAPTPAETQQSQAPATVAPVETGSPASNTQPESAPNESRGNSSDAQTTSQEQEAIRSQIENFVSQNNQTAPAEEKTSDESIMADAIKDLVTDSKDTSQPKAAAEPRVIQPPLQPSSEGLQNTGTVAGTPSTTPTTIVTPTTMPPQTTNPLTGLPTAPPPAQPQNDGVAIAHKKIISPIPGNVQEPPDLNALLAKEGISSLDDDDEQAAPPAGNTSATPVAPLPPTPTDVPNMPHQPGHVITPSGQSVDPNTISL